MSDEIARLNSAVWTRKNSEYGDAWPERGAAGAALLRGPREIGRLAWPNDGVEFHLAHGERIELLGRRGFAVERLAELYAPDQATLESRYDFLTTDWAQRWPAEEIWVARRH